MLEIQMDENRIINVLQSFSEIHGFEYDKAAVPYIPFGKIRGIINNGTFTLYISRLESRIHGKHYTNFSLKVPNLVPNGFCIEYIGNPNKKDNGFDARVEDRSYANRINFLAPHQKIELTSVFDKIDRIDEESYNERSLLRISDLGIEIGVGDLFQDVDELNDAYAKAISALKDIISTLSKK
jgi:hypothetical protein